MLRRPASRQADQLARKCRKILEVVKQEDEKEKEATRFHEEGFMTEKAELDDEELEEDDLEVAVPWEQ